jgi:hypothetical protein
MSRDFAKIKIPEPPREYSPEYERVRNARIEDLIHRRLADNALAPYGGIPNTQVTGTNAAFSVPNGAGTTILPFNSILRDTPNDAIDFNTGTFAYSVNMPIDTLMFYRLRHAAASGGAVDVIVTLFLNGVAVESYGYTARLDDVFDISDTFFPTVSLASINLPITLGISHSHSQPVTFDMTKSKWLLMQLSPNPKYLQSDTRP